MGVPQYKLKKRKELAESLIGSTPWIIEHRPLSNRLRSEVTKSSSLENEVVAMFSKLVVQNDHSFIEAQMNLRRVSLFQLSPGDVSSDLNILPGRGNRMIPISTVTKSYSQNNEGLYSQCSLIPFTRTNKLFTFASPHLKMYPISNGPLDPVITNFEAQVRSVRRFGDLQYAVLKSYSSRENE